jgi:hypothetical protein
MADQLHAACRDARRIIDLGAMTGMRRFDREPGPFVSSLLEDVTAAAMAGTLRSCRHLRGRGPAPSWVIAWRGARVSCTPCAYDVLAGVIGTPEDSVCDVCRETDQRLRPVVGAAGPLLVVFGACPGCFALEGAAA